MNNDRFGEYVTAGLAAIALLGGMAMQVVLLWQHRPESDMPLWVIGVANAFAFYYVGQKKGQTTLNGNVTRLAAATESLAASAAGKTPSSLNA